MARAARVFVVCLLFALALESGEAHHHEGGEGENETGTGNLRGGTSPHMAPPPATTTGRRLESIESKLRNIESKLRNGEDNPSPATVLQQLGQLGPEDKEMVHQIALLVGAAPGEEAVGDAAAPRRSLSDLLLEQQKQSTAKMSGPGVVAEEVKEEGEIDNAPSSTRHLDADDGNDNRDDTTQSRKIVGGDGDVMTDGADSPRRLVASADVAADVSEYLAKAKAVEDKLTGGEDSASVETFIKRLSALPPQERKIAQDIGDAALHLVVRNPALLQNNTAQFNEKKSGDLTEGRHRRLAAASSTLAKGTQTGDGITVAQLERAVQDLPEDERHELEKMATNYFENGQRQSADDSNVDDAFLNAIEKIMHGKNKPSQADIVKGLSALTADYGDRFHKVMHAMAPEEEEGAKRMLSAAVPDEEDAEEKAVRAVKDVTHLYEVAAEVINDYDKAAAADKRRLSDVPQGPSEETGRQVNHPPPSPGTEEKNNENGQR